MAWRHSINARQLSANMAALALFNKLAGTAGAVLALLSASEDISPGRRRVKTRGEELFDIRTAAGRGAVAQMTASTRK